MLIFVVPFPTMAIARSSCEDHTTYSDMSPTNAAQTQTPSNNTGPNRRPLLGSGLGPALTSSVVAIGTFSLVAVHEFCASSERLAAQFFPNFTHRHACYDRLTPPRGAK